MANISTVSDAHKEEYRGCLSSSILGTSGARWIYRIQASRIRHQRPWAIPSTTSRSFILRLVLSAQQESGSRTCSVSHPSLPNRILDAPELLDDYYLNLLSWNDSNIIAVALSQTVYRMPVTVKFKSYALWRAVATRTCSASGSRTTLPSGRRRLPSLWDVQASSSSVRWMVTPSVSVP